MCEEKCASDHRISEYLFKYLMLFTCIYILSISGLRFLSLARTSGCHLVVCLHFTFLGSPKDDDSVVSQRYVKLKLIVNFSLHVFRGMWMIQHNSYI